MRIFNLKVLNSDDSKDKNFIGLRRIASLFFLLNKWFYFLIEAEHEILRRLNEFKVSCPVPYLNKNNESYFFIDENYQVIKQILYEEDNVKLHIGRLLGNS
jgi:hypothetical protein